MKATLKPKNYTPHDIHVQLDDEGIVYPSVGVCRAEAREACAFTWLTDSGTEAHVHGWGGGPARGALVVMRRPAYDRVTWSPSPPADGADVIVSVVAADPVVEHRPDLRVFVPDTGPQSAIRYQKGTRRGQIKAIRRLVLWHDPRAKTHLLRVINLVNPVNEGDGCYVVSRHLPTLGGIAEAVAESPTGGLLELVNERGQGRLSGLIPMPGSSDVGRTWEWLQLQLRMEVADEASKHRLYREMEDWYHPEGRTAKELLEATSPSYVAEEYCVDRLDVEALLEWAGDRPVTAAERFRIATRRPRSEFPNVGIETLLT